MEPFVNAEWLAAHRPDVRLIDIRWYLDGRSGRESYEAGHAPGAVFIDLEEWLAGPPSAAAGRHPLPSPDVFARGMALHGISSDSTVVAYDDVGGVIAARLVWMLRVTGHAAALLDGGLAVFGDDLQSGPSPDVEEGNFAAVLWPLDRLASIDDAAACTVPVIDARDRDRFEGAPHPIDPRFGHIPGARSVPCRENVDGSLLRSLADVRTTFEAVGVRAGSDVISYCGSGITACHNLLTLEWVGLGPGRLFPGSWSQYSLDTNRPVATGSD